MGFAIYKAGERGWGGDGEWAWVGRGQTHNRISPTFHEVSILQV